MKLTVQGYKPLVFPPEACVPMKGAFDGNTPYVAKIVERWKKKSYLESKLPLKLLCLEILKERAEELGDYKSYSDPMAGVGISARIFGEGQKRKLILNDFDPSCCTVLRANFKEEVTSDDILNSPMRKADMIFLDFNDFTFKRAGGKYKEPLEAAMSAAGEFIVLNDCSPFYLRYGAKAFKVYSDLLGQEVHSIEDYFKAVAKWYARTHKWYLIHVAYFSETSFMLLSREHSKLVIRKVEKATLPKGMVVVEE